jgi:TonB family protein
MKRLLLLFLLLPAMTRAEQASPPLTMPVPAGRHVCAGYFPNSALMAQESGVTDVSYFIATDGSVHDPLVTRPSGHGDLDDATLRCIASWQYKPAMRGGVPLEVAAHASIGWWTNTNAGNMPPAWKPLSCADFATVTPGQLAGIDGKSVVWFLARPTGAVVEADLAQSSGNGDLDKAALRCVDEWQFDPSTVSAGTQAKTTVDWTNPLPMPQ